MPKTPKSPHTRKPPHTPKPKPVFKFHSRYLKDVSLENHDTPLTTDTPPKTDIGVRVGGRAADALYEIELVTTVKATVDSHIQFLAEVTYAGLFEIIDVDVDQSSRFLYVEAPEILFVHAQRIIADLVRDGGFPALSLATPDFHTAWKLKAGQTGNVQMEIPQEYNMFDN